MKHTLLTLSLLILLAGCSLVPQHLNKSSTGDHAHTPEQATDPNHHQNPQDNAMKEHCKMMPDMPECQSYQGDSIDHSHHQGEHNHADMIQSEFDFIYLMIPHHQEAVDTTTALLTTTSNPALITLGKAIISGQTKEIEMMKGRLNTWYSGMEYKGMPYMPMMQQTDGLSTGAIDTQWIKDMIKHHQGALDMANKLITILDTSDESVNATGAQLEFRIALRKFANDIITTQQKEIQIMQQILTN